VWLYLALALTDLAQMVRLSMTDLANVDVEKIVVEPMGSDPRSTPSASNFALEVPPHAETGQSRVRHLGCHWPGGRRQTTDTWMTWVVSPAPCRQRWRFWRGPSSCSTSTWPSEDPQLAGGPCQPRP
jgi:hypothetical protein